MGFLSEPSPVYDGSSTWAPVVWIPRISVWKGVESQTTGPQTRQWTITPRKINIEPENDGLEDDFPFQMGDL